MIVGRNDTDQHGADDDDKASNLEEGDWCSSRNDQSKDEPSRVVEETEYTPPDEDEEDEDEDD